VGAWVVSVAAGSRRDGRLAVDHRVPMMQVQKSSLAVMWIKVVRSDEIEALCATISRKKEGRRVFSQIIRRSIHVTKREVVKGRRGNGGWSRSGDCSGVGILRRLCKSGTVHS
jgi:hypothetical protein